MYTHISGKTDKPVVITVLAESIAQAWKEEAAAE